MPSPRMSNCIYPMLAVVDEGEEAEVPQAKPVKPSRKARTQQAEKEKAAQLQDGTPQQPTPAPELAYAGAQQPAYNSKQRTRPARRS